MRVGPGQDFWSTGAKALPTGLVNLYQNTENPRTSVTAILIVSVAESNSIPLHPFYSFCAPLWLHSAFAPGCLQPVLHRRLSSGNWNHSAHIHGKPEMPGSLCPPGWPLASDWWVKEYKTQFPCLESWQNLRCSIYLWDPLWDQNEAGTFPDMESLPRLLPLISCFSHSLTGLPREHFLSKFTHTWILITLNPRNSI